MQPTHLIAAAALLASAGLARAQPAVEFRFIEREGQTNITVPFGGTPTTDGELNFAIQARVVGGTSTQFLGNFGFDIVANNEADANGALSKLLISNSDGTYAPNTAQSTNATVNRGGLAAIYCYLAGIMPTFNGLINTSGGTFTNTTGSQEIGLITGSPSGGALLLLTDLNGDGNPDTYPGTGTTAPINPTIAATYLGAAGNFVDIYRFKYSTSVATRRTITFHLANLQAQIGSSLQIANSVWGPVQANATFSATTISIVVGGVCCNPDGSCALTATCLGGVFFGSATCQPNPCPQPGTCCSSAGSCAIGSQSNCVGQWTLGGACQPNPCPQPGACCTPAGPCTFLVQSDCAFPWISGGTCLPNPCPQPGKCCAPAGTCTFGLQSACTDVWTQGGTCNPNPCPQPGRCCTSAGPCTITLQSACVGVWSPTGGCAPSPCPGACCLSTACTFTDEMTCLMGMGGNFHGSATTCGTTGNPTSCCPANFNMLGGITTQDIFDYLAAWFAGDLRADFDHDGHLSPYDIFAFLHDWFAGC